jgi:hypothetical protein
LVAQSRIASIVNGVQSGVVGTAITSAVDDLSLTSFEILKSGLIGGLDNAESSPIPIGTTLDVAGGALFGGTPNSRIEASNIDECGNTICKTK